MQPSPMSLGTVLNTPAPDVNEANSPAPERIEREQQQTGGGEASFELATAAARLRTWSAMRDARRETRFAPELPSPGHQNPMFDARTPVAGSYYGLGPAMHAPAPAFAPMHGPPAHVGPPPHVPTGIPFAQQAPFATHAPYAQQAPYAQSAPYAPHAPFATHAPSPWGVPMGPTYRKKYDPAPSFAGTQPGPSRRGGATARGYEREVRDWLEMFGDALADHGFGPNKVVMLLAMQLTGTAKAWYHELKNREPNNPAFQDVEAWLSAIRTKFTDPNIELEAMATLKDLKQANGKGSLRIYISAFNRCVSILGAEGDTRIKYDFVRGLLPQYRDKIVTIETLRGPMTLEEQQRMLEQYEVTVAETTTYYTNP